ncbi:MAG TPA: hypothetical protein VJ691_17280 [Vicinamibacterales bacterium]|nr:hypothetical protein [Vicinamibacterales bacterium]
MSPSTVGRFVVATAAAAGWYISGSVTQDAVDVRAPQPSVARPTSSSAIPDFGFNEKLRDRMKQSPMPRRGRNPFAYGSRHAAVAAAPQSSPEPALPPLHVEPPLPVFKLSGIAATQVDGARVLTAIIIDNGTMVLVKAGDKLSNGHSVVSVDEMSVTLIDAAGVTQTLRLP